MPFHGKRLREAREKQGISQRELAARSGLDEAQLSRYEHGKTEPSARYLEIFAKHLDISSDFLLGLTDDPRKRYGDVELIDDERAVLETYRRDGWPGILRLGAEQISK